MLVSDLFDMSAARGSRPAVIDADGRLSYRQLSTAVDQAAGWLQTQGVSAGQRVLYAGGNHRAFLAMLYATLRIGAIFVPVSPELTDAQVSHIVEDCTPALAVCSPGAGEGAGHTVEADRAWLEIQRAMGAPAGSGAAVPDDSPAILIYTSGTTGRPKGVVCPHQQVVAAVRAVQSCLGYRGDDVVLCRVPLSFDYGLYQALLCALSGATLVLAGRGEDIRLLELIERHAVTVVPLVPSLAHMLAMLQRRFRRSAKVRLFTNTGARPGRAVMAELLRAFPGSQFASMYGMTECKRISILPPRQYAVYPDSVGPAIPGDQIRIVDGDKHTLGRPYETGEIVVWGATVMAGYWGVPVAAQKRFLPRPDGSLELHTGDQGYLDESGRLYFVGRDDDMVKRRGVRISLAEIEHAAERIPGVTAAVALRPDPDDGPLQLVVIAALPPQEIRARLTQVLDPARLPSQITPVDALPLTPNGKPDRAAARQLTVPLADPR